MNPINNYPQPANRQVEVADILRCHIGDYLKKYNMPPEHYRVVYDILNCRTAYLGGHVEMCDQCAAERILYNSCRNRHCPKCQTITKQRWLSARQAELLPVNYFHNVFTLPHELNPLILCNKPLMLGFLFQAASQTLLDFGKNPDNGLGGQLGIIAILHTWTQTLMDHFHLHCLVPGGVIADNGKEWISSKGEFLFPVKALSKVFRGKFISYLEEAYSKNQLCFPGNTRALGTRQGFRRLIKQLWSKNWVVYTKPPIERPEWVLDYLGRYTHRIAISNHRITDFSDGRVTFTIKNRKRKTTETVTLDAVEFIRRFLLHVLPKRFVRIRHYGFLANRGKKKNIGLCRLLMNLSPDIPVVRDQSVQAIMMAQAGIDILRCPRCKQGRMRKIYEIPEGSGNSSFHILRPVSVSDKDP
ncbi:putative transposase y4qJ [Desulfosarcina ovata subsp. sediminis]|uniref:Putative transposase y4qJ n=1 Tax=Desulfosarcina ovata subsp. sediminis TaxID=885957 RepID=A0A5K7ZHA0_9BACT|nr:IS91 family transposase [Desulfosarcina ovata]BBO81578.1 putative transposase y4qJ [Desulfosarcina ovata subsp. sediminis]BBO82528.1 putative transposase y4qJ [Desulfosarcina ovata subsp. sediminis]BBO82983.1 putative transposase y4qJ [Desulfosarcina ovata subsp. sediminis]BBO83302.1 putative transposase y4qJ [Desulfosarcina ovata subsp. sediminis]BBO83306.1 putative transposase y4qJ [Desulfosarcina ovata subsp. sediminis]